MNFLRGYRRRSRK